MIASIVKNVLFVLLSSLLLAGCIAKAENEITDQVRQALTKSNYRMLAHRFANRVTIEIDHETFSYSKTQATFVMRDFFRKHPAINFRYLHQGIMTSGRNYTLSTYQSPSRTYSLAILLIPHNKDFLIEKLIFVETNP